MGSEQMLTAFEIQQYLFFSPYANFQQKAVGVCCRWYSNFLNASLNSNQVYSA